MDTTREQYINDTSEKIVVNTEKNAVGNDPFNRASWH
jgi:hypothetical protein